MSSPPPAPDPARRADLAAAFRRILPHDAVIDAPTSLAAYECDGLSAYRQSPLLVVLPANVAEVQAALALCREREVPVVGRGAGTSLSGGALPHAEGIVLSLTKMNQILNIDSKNRTATVQPGVRNIAVSEAVRHLGLFYAPDPSSQIACSIGGNVAENAGGVHCLKYGLTLHNIARIKVATIDGELLTLGGGGFDAPGFDLLALLIGSEGMLGIVVEVTLRLLPLPEAARLVMGVFDSVEQAGDGVAALIAEGVIPAAVEMMDNAAIRAVEKFAGAGYPQNAAAILLCEVDGAHADVAAQTEKVTKSFRAHGAVDTQLARDDAERALFWSGRKAALPAVGRISPDYYCMDGTIPRKSVGRVLLEIEKLGNAHGLRVVNVFHAGDGNLHPLILYDADTPGELEKTERLGEKILELCIQVGGTITGEHGVGVEKIDGMCAQFTDAEREQFHKVRDAFDPQRLLNRGKALPTLARCAEYNAMHVHAGQLPHAHLERF